MIPSVVSLNTENIVSVGVYPLAGGSDDARTCRPVFIKSLNV